jgi:hypothetical protein
MADPNMHVFIDFIGSTDSDKLSEWRPPDPGGVEDYRIRSYWMSSVTEYDLAELAQGLAGAMGTQGKPGYYGVFYDPVDHVTIYAENSLRQQVRDFIEWLKEKRAI